MKLQDIYELFDHYYLTLATRGHVIQLEISKKEYEKIFKAGEWVLKGEKYIPKPLPTISDGYRVEDKKIKELRKDDIIYNDGDFEKIVSIKPVFGDSFEIEFETETMVVDKDSDYKFLVKIPFVSLSSSDIESSVEKALLSLKGHVNNKQKWLLDAYKGKEMVPNDEGFNTALTEVLDLIDSKLKEL